MVTVVYDGTFEGWLTVVFEVYEYKFTSVSITTKERFQANVFNKHHESLQNFRAATIFLAELTPIPGIRMIRDKSALFISRGNR